MADFEFLILVELAKNPYVGGAGQLDRRHGSSHVGEDRSLFFLLLRFVSFFYVSCCERGGSGEGEQKLNRFYRIFYTILEASYGSAFPSAE